MGNGRPALSRCVYIYKDKTKNGNTTATACIEYIFALICQHQQIT